MIPKKAIEKAIEGGWKPTTRGFRFKEFTVTTAEAFIATQGWEVVALDPTFWQSLFKEYKTGLPFKIHERHLPQWHQQANRFYDLVLTGDDTDAFWNDLLT